MTALREQFKSAVAAIGHSNLSEYVVAIGYANGHVSDRYTVVGAWREFYYSAGGILWFEIRPYDEPLKALPQPVAPITVERIGYGIVEVPEEAQLWN